MLSLILIGRSFGISSNLRTVCSLCGAGAKIDFFNYNYKSKLWNLLFLAGTIIGGGLAANLFSNNMEVVINPDVQAELLNFGLESNGFYLPEKLFGIDSLSDWKVLSFLLLGGFLVGFGARYAGGCTSGHAISGLSNLQIPSLISVIGFFIGGLIATNILIPFIFNNWL